MKPLIFSFVLSFVFLSLSGCQKVRLKNASAPAPIVENNLSPSSIGIEDRIVAICQAGANKSPKSCSQLTEFSELYYTCHAAAGSIETCGSLVRRADLIDICEAGITRTDTCSFVEDENLKIACLATAYEESSYCDDIKKE